MTPSRRRSGAGPTRSTTTRERLSRERVVAAALAVVDREGLEGLTMRALGRELGVDPMAAYHHVPNKAAILQGVVEAIMAEVVLPPPGAELAWSEVIRSTARTYRRALLDHPNALPIVSTQPPLTPVGLRFIEATAALLVGGGLSPLQALEAINGGGVIVIGSTLAEAGVTPGSQPVEQGYIEEAYANLTADAFPTITAVMALGSPESFDPELQFEALLDAYVLGLEQRFAITA